VVAMVVTVVAVVAFILLRSLISADVEIEPENVDYLEKVEQAQGAGVEPVYPPALPEGWQATGAELTPGQPPGFGLTLLTDDEKFVGLRQENDSTDDLLDEYVDDGADEGDPFEVTGSVAPTWETYSDTGGDLAYAAEVGDTIVLVYGSADRADIEALVGSLTTRPLPTSAPSP
jgi:hypothetical protein